MRRKFLVLTAALFTFSSAALIVFTSVSSIAIFVPSGRFSEIDPVFAYYYGWYTNNAWFSGINGHSSLAVADTPLLGLYDSQNVSVIDNQISEAVSARINGFIASWWGPRSYTDNTDQILLNQASSKFSDFTISLYFETTVIQQMNTTNQTKQASQIVSDVQYIMQNYGSSDVFTRIDGRDVLFFSGVSNWPLQFWTNVVDEVHASYPSLLLISDSLNVDYLSVFDGAASYVDLGYMTQSLTLVNG